ncbi:hypothetical protein ACTXT7_016291, partial [Hymenolepis weldensis]
ISPTPLELPCSFVNLIEATTSPYFQPMDPADLTYEKVISKLGSVVGDNSSLFNFTIREDENVHHYVGIVNRLCTNFQFGLLKKTNSDVSFSFLVSHLHDMLRFESDFCPTWTRNPISRSHVADSNLLQDHNYPTNIRSTHSQDATFAENVVFIKIALSDTSLPELQQQWPHRRLLPRIFYEHFNEAESE